MIEIKNYKYKKPVLHRDGNTGYGL